MSAFSPMVDYFVVPDHETLAADQRELAVRVRVSVTVSWIRETMCMTLHHVFLQGQCILVLPAPEEPAAIVEVRSELSGPDRTIWDDGAVALNPTIRNVNSLTGTLSWIWHPGNDGAHWGHFEVVNAVFVVVNVIS